jgi:hypothetical protein
LRGWEQALIEIIFSGDQGMDRKTKLAAEFQALRTLCDESVPRNLRQNLIRSLGPRAFSEPEHQVVFDSIRVLFPRGPVSREHLRIHLNNRGFPDTDIEKYFQPVTANGGLRDEAGEARR